MLTFSRLVLLSAASAYLFGSAIDHDLLSSNVDGQVNAGFGSGFGVSASPSHLNHRIPRTHPHSRSRSPSHRSASSHRADGDDAAIRVTESLIEAETKLEKLLEKVASWEEKLNGSQKVKPSQVEGEFDSVPAAETDSAMEVDVAQSEAQSESESELDAELDAEADFDPEAAIRSAFEDYKIEFNKHYSSAEEEAERFQIFKTNYASLPIENDGVQSSAISRVAGTGTGSGNGETNSIPSRPIYGLTIHSDATESEIQSFTGLLLPSNGNFTEAGIKVASPSEGLLHPSLASSFGMAATPNNNLGATALPPNFDWRSYGVVTPIKNQAHCGDW